MQDVRSTVIFRRTYSRPKGNDQYETFEEMIDRVCLHQRWLWERQLGRKLNKRQETEIETLRNYMMQRKVTFGGRVLWLAGTDLVRRREISMFNCSGIVIRTIHDVVDAFWLLLNGAGVGFVPVPGVLNGFSRPINDIEVIRSQQKGKSNEDQNTETWDPENKIWKIIIGDSGEAWAKSIGKLLAGKYPAEKLVLDFSRIRPAGSRLSGYGWISSGDSVISEEYLKICAIMNRKAGRLLDHIDILDIINHLGVIQTGRRGAEIALYFHGDTGWERFATAKKDYATTGNRQRAQSNNSLMFRSKPTRDEIDHLFGLMLESGGSEPGIINYQELKKRAPYAELVNPCVEALLADKGLCNLCEVNLSVFDNMNELLDAVHVLSRANYRQTLVDLDDGILQRAWHENNEFIRLCGVSLTGIATRPDLCAHDFKMIRNAAISGINSIARELGTPYSKNITLVKPSGTVSKMLGTTEGFHFPIGRYIFNNIKFSVHDPLVGILADHGYRVFDDPYGQDNRIVTFPVSYEDVPLPVIDGKHVYSETAVSQLERYRMLMRNYTDQNVSVTIKYDESEIKSIVDWLDRNWDDYVGVSFLPRQDYTKTAEDLGYMYLPQEVVTEKEFKDYVSSLREIPDELIYGYKDNTQIIDAEECAGGVCPVR